MLSRLADFMFWLGRNVERAETLARVLDVNHTRAVDHYLQRDGRSDALWDSVMRGVGFTNEPNVPRDGSAVRAVMKHIAFDAENPSSIVSGVRIARSNALGIRSELTVEVWETINVLYLYVEAQDLDAVMRVGPSRFLHRIRDMSQAFAGICDATLNHGDGWNFLQIGRYLERAYLTARILAAVDVQNEPWPESQRLLEMCCASVPFVQQSHRAPEARDAISFIVLSSLFPRSIRFCVREIDSAMHRMSRTPKQTYTGPAERRLGRLLARLDYSTIEEIVADDVRAAAEGFAMEMEALTAEIETMYFPRLPITA